MPWTKPNFPSIQLACLKAYLDSSPTFEGNVYCYSGYLDVYFGAFGPELFPKFAHYQQLGEIPFLLLFAKRFLDGCDDLGEIARNLDGISETTTITESDIDALDKSTKAFIVERIIPKLSKDRKNVIGFTLNYNQVYASVYSIYLLREFAPTYDFVFLLGGMSAAQPVVVDTLRRIEVDAYLCTGEGEGRLELFLEGLSTGRFESDLSTGDTESTLPPGICHVSESRDLRSWSPTNQGGQVTSLSDLPLPDYDEYFETLRSFCANDETFESFRAQTCCLLVEGSRGCFANCDFCGLNHLWDGFRHQQGNEVLSRTLALINKYKVSSVSFVDNVSDTWFRQFVADIIAGNSSIPSFLEIRASHSEKYWVQMYLAGIKEVQVGIEALSSSLLRKMNKGTKVIQNLQAHKYLQELGIEAHNNIITHHSRSTVQDVDETQRILEHIPHFRVMNTSKFGMQVGSPIYDELGDDEKRALVPARGVYASGVPKQIRQLLFGFYFEPPHNRGQEAVMKRWDNFIEWYDSYVSRINRGNPILSVQHYNLGDRQFSFICDTRNEEYSHETLEGVASQIYEFCHRGRSREEICARFDLDGHEFSRILDPFLVRRWTIRCDDRYLSLATRPANTLISAYISEIQ